MSRGRANGVMTCHSRVISTNLYYIFAERIVSEMENRSERERFISLLTGTISSLCNSGLIGASASSTVSSIDGLLGITLSNNEVFLVKINENFSLLNDAVSSDDISETDRHAMISKSHEEGTLRLKKRKCDSYYGRANEECWISDFTSEQPGSQLSDQLLPNDQTTCNSQTKMNVRNKTVMHNRREIGRFRHNRLGFSSGTIESNASSSRVPRNSRLSSASVTLESSVNFDEASSADDAAVQNSVNRVLSGEVRKRIGDCKIEIQDSLDMSSVCSIKADPDCEKSEEFYTAEVG